MKIQNLNPTSDIGASAWLVEIEGRRLLLDAGVHPKREGNAALPLFGAVPGTHLDALLLSHCHHDHVGGLPVALRRFPDTRVWMTELSYFLIERVLHNSVNVMTRQREELGLAEYPLYTHREVDDIAPRFEGYRYGRELRLGGSARRRGAASELVVEFRDAGHTLGSAGILVRGRRETLFYTGDVSFADQTLMCGARFDDVSADVLILETTRGNHTTPAGFSREAEVERLAETLQRVLKRRGSVLIPTFALGRTQEILGVLALLTRAGRLRRQPIYIGGLGRVFTEIYDLQAHRTHRQHPSLQLHEALQLEVLDPPQTQSLRLSPGRLFVLTAGMLTENTAAHDLAVRLMADERHAICFVGYADPDTPGGRLKASRPGRPFHFSNTVGEVVRHCEVLDFDLTAHANREELVDFVGAVHPRVVILGHGDAAARAWVATALRRRHPRLRIFQPAPGEGIAL